MSDQKLVIRQGSKGDLVRMLQELLGIHSDGDFGPKTRNAVVSFQKQHNITPDGIVGPMTWDALNFNPMELYADTDVITSATWIERYHLPEGEYIKEKTAKKFIFIHHTAGRHNPYKTIDDWASDQRGRVGTNYVIGGLPATYNPSIAKNNEMEKYDGRVLQAVDDMYWAYHLGPVKSRSIARNSISIEICSAGALTKRGNDYYTWYNAKVDPSQVCELATPFRGTKYYHKYSQKQLESLEALLRQLANKHYIDLDSGLQKWVLKEGNAAFEYKREADLSQVNGILSHTNVRLDKSDVFPQPELIELIKRL